MQINSCGCVVSNRLGSVLPSDLYLNEDYQCKGNSTLNVWIFLLFILCKQRHLNRIVNWKLSIEYERESILKLLKLVDQTLTLVMECEYEIQT